MTEPRDARLLVYWVIGRGFTSFTSAAGNYNYFSQSVSGYDRGSSTHWGPKLILRKGYTGIDHDVKLWGYWDGTGDHELWKQYGGDALVVGKNLITEVANIASDTVWQAGFEDPENELYFPPFCPTWPPGCVSYYINRNSQLEIQSYWPVEDWKFNFCKHSDFGGDVTWHI